MKVYFVEQKDNLNIVGVRFRERGKVYSFDASDFDLEKNDRVIVDTESGMAIGTIVTEARFLPIDKLPGNLKKVVRKATESDLKIEEDNKEVEKKAFYFCCEKIKQNNLPMKLVDIEYLFEKTRMIFYFTAEKRVDFRELVKELVQKYKTRIELRQIWVRNEARMFGGIGMCGRELCCVSFLRDFGSVSIKMVKKQNMLLNPEKVSGLCGRLMCCFAFEHADYIEADKKRQECCAQAHKKQEKPAKRKNDNGRKSNTKEKQEPPADQ